MHEFLLSLLPVDSMNVYSYFLTAIFWFASFSSWFCTLLTYPIKFWHGTGCDTELTLLGHICNSNWSLSVCTPLSQCYSQSWIQLFYYVSLWTLLWISCHQDLVVILMTHLYEDLYVAYFDLKSGRPNWFSTVFPQSLSWLSVIIPQTRSLPVP
jgi:hypothetical protein